MWARGDCRFQSGAEGHVRSHIPAALIVVGLNRTEVNSIFASCTLAGHTSNRYGVLNEETRDHPDIFVCRDLRAPWPAFWQKFRHYG